MYTAQLSWIFSLYPKQEGQLELDSLSSQEGGQRLSSLLLLHQWGSYNRQDPGLGYSLGKTLITETLGWDGSYEEMWFKTLQ